MGENKEKTKASQSILDEIMSETFQKLDDNEDFDSEIVLELRNLFSEDSMPNDKSMISILRGDSQ